MKRFFSLALAAVLLIALALPVLAEEEHKYVWDEAMILSQEEHDELEALAERLTEEHSFGVYIMTVDDYTDYGNGDVYDVSTELFLEKGLGVGTDADGILLLMSMDERDYAFCAHGYGETAFTAYTSGELEQEFLDNFRKNDWYGGFVDYLQKSVEIVEFARSGGLDEADRDEDYYDSHDYYGNELSTTRELTGGEIVSMTILPCIIAGIVCGIKAGKHKSVKQATNAERYIIPMSLNLYNSQDIFTHVTETRTRIDTDSGGSRSGGGGGHSSFHSGGGFSGRSGKF